MKVLISESSSARPIDGVWHSLLRCHRRRCKTPDHLLPVQAEHVEPVYGPRVTAAETAERKGKEIAFWTECASHPLPAGWVQLRVAGEDRLTDSPKNFCSSHCAALWLNAYQREQQAEYADQTFRRNIV